MAKRIAYTISSSGVDGREPKRIEKAFWNEDVRNKEFDNDPNKNYLTKGEQIVNEDEARKTALAKLDGIDTLILNLNPQ
jgi:hypothetical protein